MESVKHIILEQFRQELINEVPDAEAILEKLDRAELALRRAEPVEYPNSKSDKPHTWLLYYEPGQRLRERFDLAPELLMLLLPRQTAQAKDIAAAERQLLSDYRLDRGLVLVVSRDPGAQSRLEQAAGTTRRTYIFQSFDQMTEVTDPQRWLRKLLLDQLGSSQLFERGNPVSGWHFFGRKNELQNLRRQLLAGRPVGLYGLRKIGKTSLLQIFRHQLIIEAREAIKCDDGTAQLVVPILFDLQRISFAEANRRGFMRQLILCIYEALDELGLDPGSLQLPPELGRRKYLNELDGQKIERTGTRVIDTLIDWAQEQPGQRRLLLILDEYERILGGSSFYPEHGVQVFDYLRGLVQSYPGIFNFLIAGLSRRQASIPKIADRQNPLFNFLMDFPMAGLAKEEMRDLIYRIGRRLSLEFSSMATSLIWEETGGHPYLARQFGHIVDQHVSIHDRDPKKSITVEIVKKLLPAFRRHVAPTMEELLQTVLAISPEAPSALSYLQSHPGEADAVLSELPDKDVEDLRRLGILEDSHQKKIRIGCFGVWLQTNWEMRPEVAVGG